MSRNNEVLKPKNKELLSNKLIEAVRNNQLEIVKNILEGGADVNLADKYGDAPLHLAAQNGCQEIAELLIASGANINFADKGGVTPLHLATHFAREEIAQFLIASGADVNLADQDGDAPLHFVAENGCQEIIKHLIAGGANVNLANQGGVTPLMIAIKTKNYDLTKELIEKRAYVNLKDVNGETALTLAVKLNKNLSQNNENLSQIIESLLLAGAYYDISNNEGKDYLTYAEESGKKNIIASVVAKKVTQMEILTGATSSYEELKDEKIKLLFNSGLDINREDDSSFTPLTMVANFQSEFDYINPIIQCFVNSNQFHNQNKADREKFIKQLNFDNIKNSLIDETKDLIKNSNIDQTYEGEISREYKSIIEGIAQRGSAEIVSTENIGHVGVEEFKEEDSSPSPRPRSRSGSFGVESSGKSNDR